MKLHHLALVSLVVGFMSCNTPSSNENAGSGATAAETTQKGASGGLAPELAQKYTTVTLTSDLLAGLTAKEKQMIPLLVEAAEKMDALFWKQAYGDKDAFLSQIPQADVKRFAAINYGPWDRLDGNKPFMEGVGPKALGAQFYPQDLTKEEMDQSQNEDLKSLYTLVARAEDGTLTATPFRIAYKKELRMAASLMMQAAELAEDDGLKGYLNSRAIALLNGKYYDSDLEWMDMKTNTIDFVVGPIEVYEDELFNYKASFEAYLLIKDKQWSERLSKYAAFLPELQTGLPVDAKYKTETPGSNSDLNVYDVIYYAGHCNAGSKTIAINLPNDEKVQLEKGTRRLQLKNAMKAKFDKILLPIAEVLIDPAQRSHINFDAFFSNTMFHEVAHGLGIKNTITGKGTVREALLEKSSALEEGKADVLGLYMIMALHEKGEIQGDLKDHYVTFFTSIFRSIRFGASSAHGRANLLRFNYFREMEAFSRDEESGTYRVNFDKIEAAVTALSRDILTLQGDGDYEGVAKIMAEKGQLGPVLENDLKRLEQAHIPTDIVFDQGLHVLNLD